MGFKKLIVWLWDSPTFTAWGSICAQVGRLVVVTPLVVTRFDEVEIAAWYFYASLNFLGLIVAQRIGQTFTRMFAFAAAGQSDLGPKSGKLTRAAGAKAEGRTNWQAFERAYGTIGCLNVVLAALSVFITCVFGGWALTNITEGYNAADTIWLAFVVTVVAQFFSFVWQRYALVLKGLNYVAIVNRWQMLSGFASILGGSACLLFGGGLVELALTMQAIVLLGLLRNRYLLGRVEGGRILRVRVWGLDKEVFGWAWGPAWKGFLVQLGTQGSVQGAVVAYTAVGNKSDIASLLFSLRIAQTIQQLAMAPWASTAPLMARYVAAGDCGLMRKHVSMRMPLVLALAAIGFGASGLVIKYLLEAIGSGVDLVPLGCWYLIGILTVLKLYNLMCCGVAAMGNDILFYWRTLFASVVSVSLVVLLDGRYSYWGVVLASGIPLLLFYHVRPTLLVKGLLDEPLLSTRALRCASVVLGFLFLVYVLLRVEISMGL